MGWKNLLRVMGSLTDTFWKVPPYLQQQSHVMKNKHRARTFQLESLPGLEKGHVATHPNNSHKDCIPAAFLEGLSHSLQLSLPSQVSRGPKHCSVKEPVDQFLLVLFLWQLKTQNKLK